MLSKIYKHIQKILIIFLITFSTTVFAGFEEGLNYYLQEDFEKSFNELDPLAKAGDAKALALLSSFYNNGYYVHVNKVTALEYNNASFSKIKELAESGDGFAQNSLGVRYELGYGVEKDLNQAVEWYKKSAENGYVMALTNLGIIYLGFIDGYKINNYSEGVKLIQKASEKNFCVAELILGELYLKGHGVEKNEAESIKWIFRSAEHGCRDAQRKLFYVYADGLLGQKKDESKALQYLYRLVERGDHISQALLGDAYINGRYGIKIDKSLGVKWLNTAADNNNKEAQRILGMFYYKGNLVVKNIKTARELLLKSAIQGEYEAQRQLCYINYINIEDANYHNSYFWHLLYSPHSNGIETRIEGKSLEDKLNPQEISFIQDVASKWKVGDPEPIFKMERIAAKKEDLPKAVKEPKSPLPTTTNNSNNPSSTGSSFVINSNMVITNAHVAGVCRKIKVNGVDAKRVAVDKNSDLALLSVSSNFNSVAKLSGGRIRQGDVINAVGYPLRGLLASSAQVTTGNISALAGLNNDARYIQISAPVQPGNSGGPLVDSSGNIVGVVVSKLNAINIAKITGDIPQNINFAISPAVLQSFLHANNVDFESIASNKHLSTADVIEIATKYTKLVECWE